MNDIRRGNPKKRFLWRRLLPRSEEEHNHDKMGSSREGGNNNNSLASIKASCRQRNNEFQISSSVVSPPPSPLSALSEEGDSSTNSLLLRPKKTTQQAAPKMGPVSASTSVSSSHQEESKDESLSNEEDEPPTQAMFSHGLPRPFLASVDSPQERPSIGEPQTTIAFETGSSSTKSSGLPKPCVDDSLDMSTKSSELSNSCSDHCADNDDDRDDNVEEASFEKARLVLSTAASVLLLMRFSVTDQALNSLTSGIRQLKDSKETTKEKEESTTEAKPASPAPEATVPSTSPDIPIVSPEKSKLCIQLSRRVSLEDSTPLCPNRLAMPEDPNELNSLHCFVRAHLLEVFSLPAQKDKPGRVGLRCVFCSHLPRKDRSGTTMCTFYPKSLQDLYRSVMTWQRIHFRGCKHVSPKIKEEYWKHKESDQTRGKTTYWVTSAMRLGLQDINNGRNGICFECPKQSS